MPKPDNLLKIMVAGEGGVGKTTLLLKYVSGVFHRDTSMTLGIQFHFKKIINNGKEYELQLWDLGGQDRFRFLLSSFTIGARGALLLYDVTCMASLDSLEEWATLCRTHNRRIPILLCGTKVDLVNDRCVPADYAEGYLQDLNLFGHLEMSAKTGQNVDKAFELILQKILDEGC